MDSYSTVGPSALRKVSGPTDRKIRYREKNYVLETAVKRILWLDGLTRYKTQKRDGNGLS